MRLGVFGLSLSLCLCRWWPAFEVFRAPRGGLELLRGYSATVDAVLRELDACETGDEVLFSVYVVEPGNSSEAVLGALASAARRGVRLRLRTDCSVLSSFTRLCEGTTTLAHRLKELSENMPEVHFEQPQMPTHAKFLIFRRKSESTAIFGGINFGDRFRSWRDFAVRLHRGVGDLEASLGLAKAPRAGPSADGSIHFVANRPKRFQWPEWLMRHPFEGGFPLVAEMRRFYSDHERYRVSACYIDGAGAEVLSCALRRGAAVELVMPRRPNVYEDCNARTLGKLLSWKSLSLKLHGDMVHAKAAVAEGPKGRVAMIGSCNLKHRSFTQFEELQARVTDRSFCSLLWDELGRLLGEAEEVRDCRIPFSPVMACLQDYFG